MGDSDVRYEAPEVGQVEIVLRNTSTARILEESA
jgi:hypothetical protein